MKKLITVDSVKIGDTQTEGFALEIGAMNYGFDLDGIIGLDLLQQFKGSHEYRRIIITVK